MPLLDQFRRPDRGKAPTSAEDRPKPNPLKDAHPASFRTAVAEDSRPNHADQEDAA